MSQSRTTITDARGRQGVQRRAMSASMYSNTSTLAGNSRKRSIKDRLGGDYYVQSSSGTDYPSKRQRDDDTAWRLGQHTNEGYRRYIEQANVPAGSQDLRMKLEQKSALRAAQAADFGSSAISAKVPREKPVGPALVPKLEHQQDLQRHAVSVVRGTSAAIAPGISRMAGACTNPAPKTPVLGEQNVAALLQSLGLTKYLLSFQVEEVDMAALRHMNDEDLKELGLPMGPRRKILLALSSRR